MGRWADPNVSDRELVRRALERDPDACRLLAERVKVTAQRRIDGVLVRAVRSGSLPLSTLREDALQEFLYTLFKDDAALLRAWDPERQARLAPYAGTIAVNVALNVVSKHRRRARNETPEDKETLDLTPSRRADDSPERVASARQLAQSLLRELDPEERAMVVAYFLERRGAKEVAERFGRTEHAVHVWANRLRARLSHRVGDAGKEVL